MGNAVSAPLPVVDDVETAPKVKMKWRARARLASSAAADADAAEAEEEADECPLPPPLPPPRQALRAGGPEIQPLHEHFAKPGLPSPYTGAFYACSLLPVLVSALWRDPGTRPYLFGLAIAGALALGYFLGRL